MGNRYGLEIRAAAGTDAPGLAALMAEAGVQLGASDCAARLDAFRSVGGTALVAVEWGPPSGIVALSCHRTLESPRPVGLITTLLVASESRRRGIGRVLLKAAARAARQAGCERLILHAAPGASDLRAFCAATGFADDGIVRVRPLLRRGGGDA